MRNFEIKPWMDDVLLLETDQCIDPPFTQKAIYWRGQTMTVQRAVCGEKNGWDVDLDMVPVRKCGTERCANGKHYRWGPRKEAQAYKAVPRDHSGSKNPNSKLSWEKACEIRAAIAAVPAPEGHPIVEGMFRRRSNISAAEFAVRRELAAKYGVTLRTIANVMAGKVWNEAEASESPTDTSDIGDEF